ncbi:unnamed protein product [Ixodes persulcatus]
MDLFPREGKYSHFCNIPMQHGCRTADGSWQLAVVSVLCNFPKPTTDKPSLLTHNEQVVKTNRFLYFERYAHQSILNALCKVASHTWGKVWQRGLLQTEQLSQQFWCCWRVVP